VSNVRCTGAKGDVMATQRERFIPFLLFGLVACLSAVTWNQPVTSMPMNRNDASCYLLLAHNMAEHGVYSLDQQAPFRPHTEWPPGVPLLYAIPVALAGGFPLGNSAWIVHLFAWVVAAGSMWCVFHYVRLFAEAHVAWLVTLCTLCSRAFLEESQAAFADIPALGAMFLMLYEIEHYFRTEQRSRWRTSMMFIGLALLPLVKPYLGVTFVAFLWHLAVRWQTRRTQDAPAVRNRQFATGVALTALCCVPFACFMSYSVIAAESTGTISAVTWLVTDNPVEVREGVATTDHRTLGEWMTISVETMKFHLVYHIVASPVPLLEMVDFRDWPGPPRLLILLTGGSLMFLGALRLTLRGRGAAVVNTVAMTAVFALLACDGARYFVILTPLFAWLFLSGVEVVADWLAMRNAGGGESECSWSRRYIMVRPAFVTVLGMAALVWATEQNHPANDRDPLYDEIYSVLFELRDRDDISTIVVPFPIRELAIVETGKRVLVYAEVKADDASGPGLDRLNSSAIVWFHDSLRSQRPTFGGTEILAELVRNAPRHNTRTRNSLVQIVTPATNRSASHPNTVAIDPHSDDSLNSSAG
jgi:hypothetical protein